MKPHILYSHMLDLFEEAPDKKWHVSNEVINWFRENNIKIKEARFELIGGGHKYGLLFDNDVDFMAFKLRWM